MFVELAGCKLGPALRTRNIDAGSNGGGVSGGGGIEARLTWEWLEGKGTSLGW